MRIDETLSFVNLTLVCYNNNIIFVLSTDGNGLANIG